MRINHYNSLRGRYSVVAAVLIILVLAGAFLAHRNVSDARQHTSNNIEVRNHLLQRSRYIRDAVWKSHSSLEAFQLNPNDSKNRERVHIEINNALQNTKKLGLHPWIAEHQQIKTVNSLRTSLLRLDEAVDQFIKTRMDATRQYPSLDLAQEVMLPNHTSFYTDASLAINEIASSSEGLNSEAYKGFVQARNLWTEMVSNFRMYLANRVGSFNEKLLHTQEKNIEILYRELNRQLQILQRLKQNNALGFQSSHALEQLFKSAKHWHGGLKKVERIHHSGEWRTDIKIVKGIIEPLLENIWHLLLSLDIAIESSADEDVKALTDVAQTQTQMLWLLTILGLSFIVLGFISLERSILRPIATVAQALKEEALGEHSISLPKVTPHETHDLVNAFTEMRKQIHDRQLALEFQALHDPLTGLPNRNLLFDRLQQSIYAAHREKEYFSILMMDLDRFKEVNDTLGHQIGDQLLEQVGNRLLNTLREMDTVARLGGDEFAILLPNSDEERAKHVADKVFGILEQEFKIDSHLLYIGASIGIAVYPDHGIDAKSLLQHADVAMYVAKRNKSNHAVYNPNEDQHTLKRLALMTDLRHALETDDLDLYYMPKLEIHSGEIIGVEALLRWQHPEHGAISPDQIIPLAEQTGLIKPLTLWVLDKALRQCSIWRQKGIYVSMAVNLSVYNLQDNEHVNQIQDRLSRYNIPPHCLIVEITESAMMADPTHTVEILSRLDQMGVGLAMDDFGIGFTSLSYLKQLPVDEIKIDKSFVMNMIENEDDAVIVRSTIDLAHNLGLKVVAEGVETSDIRDILEILQCDAAQGYFLSQPLSADALERWLRAKPMAPVSIVN